MTLLFKLWSSEPYQCQDLESMFQLPEMKAGKSDMLSISKELDQSNAERFLGVSLCGIFMYYIKILFKAEIVFK